MYKYLMKLKMHDELKNSMDYSMLTLQFPTMNHPATAMNGKRKSRQLASKINNHHCHLKNNNNNNNKNHHFRSRLASDNEDNLPNPIANLDIDDECEEEDEIVLSTRTSKNIWKNLQVNEDGTVCAPRGMSTRSSSKVVVVAANGINSIPSPPSSTRSSCDGSVTREMFISDDISASYDDSLISDSNEMTSMTTTADEKLLISSNQHSNALESSDDDIKFLIDSLLTDVEKEFDNVDEKCWDDIQIDFNGETVLPNGLRIVRGVAEMPFTHDEIDDDEESFANHDKCDESRFTNQLNFLKTTLTKYLIRYKTAKPFMDPVDSVLLKIPHYYLVIKKPMDLNTVKNRLNFLWYQSAEQCIQDIRQIFTNCFMFNSPTDFVYQSGKKLEEYFNEKLKDMPEVEVEVPCPPRPTIEEYKKLTEKRMAKRKFSYVDPVTDLNRSIDSSLGLNTSRTSFTPGKMTTRSERGVMVRKPSKDLPQPMSTPKERTPSLKKVKLNESMRKCLDFVKELFTQKHTNYTWPFLEPVDVNKFPDYQQKIKRPIDLSSIKTNIQTGKYLTVKHYADDMRLMFSNCIRYNAADSPIIEKLRLLRNLFEYHYAQFTEKDLSEKLIIPKNIHHHHHDHQKSDRHLPSLIIGGGILANNSSSPSSSNHHHHRSHHHQTTDIPHNNNINNKHKKSKHRDSTSSSSSSSKRISPKIRISSGGVSISETSSEPCHENRMKILELQVERLTSALTTALMGKNGATDVAATTALLNVISNSTNISSNGVVPQQRVKRKYTKRNTGGEANKKAKLTKQKSTYKRKIRHLSSDEESDDNLVDDDYDDIDDSDDIGMNSFSSQTEHCEPFDPVNLEDLKKLKKDLENLHATDLQNVLRILQQTEPSLRCDDEQNVEIDFEALKPATLQALRKYVTSCMLNSKTAGGGSVGGGPSSSHSPKISTASNNFDIDCDNNNWSRAGSRASNLLLSESSSDSEID